MKVIKITASADQLAKFTPLAREVCEDLAGMIYQAEELGADVPTRSRRFKVNDNVYGPMIITDHYCKVIVE